VDETRRLALIHTVSSLVPVFKALCDELIPDRAVFNVVDESLLQNCIREERLTPTTSRRLVRLVVSAQEAGADAVMVTCSSMGPAVDLSRSFVDIPVFRVDEPMARAAVRLGRRVGVAATLRTTLDPTVALLRRSAESEGRTVEIETNVCEGAFAALTGGDAGAHDAAVGDALRTMGATCDVVVLAQASMARVADALSTSGATTTPMLSSPRLAVQHLKDAAEQRP
jgi:Asp/Glu/hydantoin racemase